MWPDLFYTGVHAEVVTYLIFWRQTDRQRQRETEKEYGYVFVRAFACV